MTQTTTTSKGYFGEFGGRYISEALIPALERLEDAYNQAQTDPDFTTAFRELLTSFAGRPTPLTYAANLTSQIGGAKIYLKNEGLNPTGAHKITHCLGQALLAKRMGKKRLIAETGAGQHGVAVAAVAAKFGLECTIYMGEVDMARQQLNVFMMKQFGATVVPVIFGARTLKDAVTAALKDWLEHSDSTYYLLGSALGPHPYPTMVRDFQSVIGKEIAQQMRKTRKCLPDYVIACVGGGSNAIGAFAEFITYPDVALIGVEAGGRGTKKGQHARRSTHGSVGVLEGYKSIFLQDANGQIEPTHSIAAGLDYPGIGPELAYLYTKGRIYLKACTDKQALEAARALARTEGILPALESAHAVAYAVELALTLPQTKSIVVNLSGRGDKDIFILADALRDHDFYSYLNREVDSHESLIHTSQ